MNVEHKMNDDNKTNIDILLKEYDHRFQEVLLHSKRYHKQSNYIYIFTSIIIAVCTLIFSKNTQEAIINFGLDKQTLNTFLIFFLIISISIAYYFYSTIMEALFVIYMNGSRIAFIEESINKITGKDILVWDSKLIPRFFNPRLMYKKGWVSPNIISGIWAFLFLLIITIALCITSYMILGINALFYIIPVSLLTVYHISQWILLHTVGLQSIRENIYHLDSYIDAKKKLSTRGKMNILQIEYLVALLTFILGFLVMLFLSIKLKAFDLSSPYNFPLLTLPSIFIGDALLLPIINYRFYKLLNLDSVHNLFKTYSAYFILFLIASLLISVIINFSTHYLWIKDSYTGFMDTMLGKLSIAGWWHLGFSIFQLTIIFVFISFWYLFSLKGMKAPFSYAFDTWKIVLMFTSLSIIDFLIRNLYVFKNNNLLSALKTEWATFITLILSIVIFIIGHIKLKNM